MNIMENFQRCPKMFEEDLKTFGSYTNNRLVQFNDISGVSIFTTADMENTTPESWMQYCLNFTSGVFSTYALSNLATTCVIS